MELLTWIDERSVKVLNVAGPRASKDPKIYKLVKEVLESLLILEASRKHIFGSLRFNKTPTGKDIKLPETVDEAVDRLMSEMSLKDKTTLLKMAEDDLIRPSFHSRHVDPEQLRVPEERQAAGVLPEVSGTSTCIGHRCTW